MFKKFRKFVIISAAIALVVWLINRYNQEDTQTKQVEIEVPNEPAVEPSIKPKTPPQPPAKAKPSDDLTRISGIGPKISTILQDAGVNTFEQLAGMSVEAVQEILDQSGVRLGKPDTWIEQAKQYT